MSEGGKWFAFVEARKWKIVCNPLGYVLITTATVTGSECIIKIGFFCSIHGGDDLKEGFLIYHV